MKWDRFRIGLTAALAQCWLSLSQNFLWYLRLIRSTKLNQFATKFTLQMMLFVWESLEMNKSAGETSKRTNKIRKYSPLSTHKRGIIVREQKELYRIIKMLIKAFLTNKIHSIFYSKRIMKKLSSTWAKKELTTGLIRRFKAIHIIKFAQLKQNLSSNPSNELTWNRYRWKIIEVGKNYQESHLVFTDSIEGASLEDVDENKKWRPCW